jgi:hypothetical protein
MATTKQKRKVGRVMHEYKHGELESASGRKVKNPKQAIAIAMSESGQPRSKAKRGAATRKKTPSRSTGTSKKKTASRGTASSRKKTTSRGTTARKTTTRKKTSTGSRKRSSATSRRKRSSS